MRAQRVKRGVYAGGEAVTVGLRARHQRRALEEEQQQPRLRLGVALVVTSPVAWARTRAAVTTWVKPS